MEFLGISPLLLHRDQRFGMEIQLSDQLLNFDNSQVLVNGLMEINSLNLRLIVLKVVGTTRKFCLFKPDFSMARKDLSGAIFIETCHLQFDNLSYG